MSTPTPTTPPSLAALHAERAAVAYRIEHGPGAERRTWLEVYQQMQAEIATLAAQWPARWGRQERHTKSAEISMRIVYPC